MIESQGITLTQIGVCRNEGCGAPIFAELLVAHAPRLCFNCASPPRAERQERLRDLYDRSGGRLPPSYGEGQER